MRGPNAGHVYCNCFTRKRLLVSSKCAAAFTGNARALESCFPTFSGRAPCSAAPLLALSPRSTRAFCRALRSCVPEWESLKSQTALLLLFSDLQAALQLNTERSARLTSEQAVIKLRGQLEAIAQAEEAARVQAAESLKQLQGEYASAKVGTGVGQGDGGQGDSGLGLKQEMSVSHDSTEHALPVPVGCRQD